MTAIHRHTQTHQALRQHVAKVAQQSVTTGTVQAANASIQIATGVNPGTATSNGSGSGSTGIPSGDLQSQLQSAVLQAVSAFNQANPNGSGNIEDLLKSIKDSLDKTLQSNGIDPSQLTGPAGGSPHDCDCDGDGDGSGSGGSNGPTSIPAVNPGASPSANSTGNSSQNPLKFNGLQQFRSQLPAGLLINKVA